MTTRDLAAIVKGIAPVLSQLTQQLHTRIDALQSLAKGDAGPMGPVGPEGPMGRDGRDGLPGLQGDKGTNGLNGKDGADGLGFDDLSLLYDGERTFTFRFQRASVVKEFPTKVEGLPLYRGVFMEGKTYERGDSTTWGGSEWHCNEPTTTKPGDGSKSWTLKVKRGRDGRDGHDAVSTPVVKVK
jgi:hypothetical protein